MKVNIQKVEQLTNEELVFMVDFSGEDQNYERITCSNIAMLQLISIFKRVGYEINYEEDK